MRRSVMMLAAAIAAVVVLPVAALELRASVEVAIDGCRTVIVDPEYVPPPDGGDPCVVAAIPAESTRLAWVATELWERPPQLSAAEKIRLAGNVATYDGWTKLTCGAVRDTGGWSFSCFNSGVIGEHQGHRLAGLFTGTAAQLDALVRGWWMAQR